MKKVKLLLTVATLALSIMMLTFGVFALNTVNYSLGGSITYTAPKVLASVSQGLFNNASVSNKMNAITFTGQDQSQTSNVNSWSNMSTLTIPEGETTSVISFTITNNSTSKYLKVSLSCDYDTSNSSNMTVTPSFVGNKYINNSTQGSNTLNVTITFAVTDDSVDANIDDFEIAIAMEHVAEVPGYTVTLSGSGSNVYGSVEYAINDGEYQTWSNSSYEIPDKVEKIRFKFTKNNAQGACLISVGGSNIAEWSSNNELAWRTVSANSTFTITIGNAAAILN